MEYTPELHKKVNAMEKAIHDCDTKEEALKLLTVLFMSYWMREDGAEHLGIELCNLYESTNDYIDYLKERKECINCDHCREVE